MAGFFENLSKGVSGLGTALNLPEFGISEHLGNLGKVTGSADVIPGFDPFTDRGNGTFHNPAQPTGQVMGVQSGGQPQAPVNNQLGGGGLGGGGGAANPGFLQSLMNHAGGAVQRQYEGALGILDQNRQALQGQANRGIANTDRLYGQQEQGFQSQLQGAEKDLARSQQEIETNKGEALSDLTSDLRAQMESFTRMIGAMGAADSSAAGMGQYAFGQMGQQARADIWNQANKLVSEVGYRREKVKDQFRQNMTELQNWKTNTLQAIQGDLQDKLSQLDAAKMQASNDKQAQLDAIKQQVYQEALSTAMQIDQRVISMGSANENWARQQTQTLGDVEARIQQSLAQIQTNPIAAGELSTGVDNQFSFGAGDIIRNTPGQQVGAQVALPQNRRDEQGL